MKYLLHIDTSTDIGIIALSYECELLASRKSMETRNHANTINLLIQDVLDSCNITFKDLEGIAVCAGPGSYTGLRIGMATAKGICYALNIPLFLHNRLTLLAYQSYTKSVNKFSYFISLLIAREKEYFIAIYDRQFKCTLEPLHINEEQMIDIIRNHEQAAIITDIDPILIINSLGLNNKFIEKETIINLFLWAKFTCEQFNCNKNVKLSIAEPFYLKQVYIHK